MKPLAYNTDSSAAQMDSSASNNGSSAAYLDLLGMPGFYFDPNNPPAPPTPEPKKPEPPAGETPEPPAGETPEQKALREANERIARLEEQNLRATRRTIALEVGIAPEAVEFITATDEAAMRAQAEKLKGLMPAAPAPAPPPPPAGTTTNPGGTPPEDLSAKIAEAEKSGNVLLAIRLKRQAAGR